MGLRSDSYLGRCGRNSENALGLYMFHHLIDSKGSYMILSGFFDKAGFEDLLESGLQMSKNSLVSLDTAIFKYYGYSEEKLMGLLDFLGTSSFQKNANADLLADLDYLNSTLRPRLGELRLGEGFYEALNTHADNLDLALKSYEQDDVFKAEFLSDFRACANSLASCTAARLRYTKELEKLCNVL